MDQKTTAVSLFFSGCAFFILMMLCSISHAGGFGRAGGDYSAPVKSSSNAETIEAAPENKLPDNSSLTVPNPGQPPIQPKKDEKPGSKPAAPPRLLPKKESHSSATLKEDWLDKPGNDLKLGAFILAPFSVGTLIAGTFIYLNASSEPAPHTYSGSISEQLGSGIAAGFKRASDGLLGIGVLVVGTGMGLTSLGMFICGELRARRAKGEPGRRIEISPYINPVTKRNLAASASDSLDGAVAGVTGRF